LKKKYNQYFKVIKIESIKLWIIKKYLWIRNAEVIYIKNLDSTNVGGEDNIATYINIQSLLISLLRETANFSNLFMESFV